MCDITDEEFERIYLPVCINYDNYLKEFVIPDVIAFYIADNFYKKALLIEGQNSFHEYFRDTAAYISLSIFS